MKRNQVSVNITSNMVGRKFKDFYNRFLCLGSACLESEIGKLHEPYHIEVMNYLEDGTAEQRKVTILNFGVPTQLCVNFYR